MADTLDLIKGIILTVIGLGLIYGSIIYRLIDLILIIGVLITLFGLYKLLSSFMRRLLYANRSRSRSRLNNKSNDPVSRVMESAKEVESLVNSKLDNNSNSKSAFKSLGSQNKYNESSTTLDEYLNSTKSKEPSFKYDTPIDESKQVLRTKPVKEEKPKFKIPSIRKSNKSNKRSFGYLKECFPKAISFSGAGGATARSKNQFRTLKDEAGHVAMEMVRSGLIHYEPSFANMRYNHQNMKRTGGTTILKHMVFESRIFQFNKTPNGRLAMIAKDEMKKMLKGMSPDLFDNVILLCGGSVYDCYRMLRDDAGIIKKNLQASDMLTLLNINGVEEVDTRIHKPRIRNASEVLNILSTI